MYGIFIHIWVIFRAHVGRCSVDGASGYLINEEIRIECRSCALAKKKVIQKFDSRSTKARDITMIGEILMWLVVVGLGNDPIKA